MVRLSGKKRVANQRIHWGAGEIGGPRHEYRESLMLKLLKGDFRKGSVVLDAGCGSGSLLFKLGSFDCIVHGIEQSREFVAKLHDRVKSSNISDTAHIKHGSVIDIPYPDKTFAVVVSGEVLEHVRNDAGVIMEFYRVLMPGGVCVISVPASPALWDFSDEWAGHLRRYTRKGLVNLFEKKGFIVEEAKFWGFPMVWLYHRFLYLPYVKRKASSGIPEDAITPPDSGKHQFMAKALNMIFRVDSLFRWAPFGIGLILKARKPFTEETTGLSVKIGANSGAMDCTS